MNGFDKMVVLVYTTYTKVLVVSNEAYPVIGRLGYVELVA